jgi:hypothetical protein
MSRDLSMLLSLRRALGSAAQGMGMARSLVEELGPVCPEGSGVARMLLLGFPLQISLRALLENGSHEVAMLVSLVISAPKSSTSLVGRSGEALSLTLERWVKTKENGKLEQKVLRFRSLVTSGVMGAVTAMLASLGPLVGDLNFAAGVAPSTPETLLPAAAVMTAISSAMLGLFMSGRGFFVNVAVSLGVFALVSAVAYPLANVSAVGLWGVK